MPLWIHAFWSLAMAFGAAATILTYRVVYETNKLKDEQRHEDYLWWSYGKMDRIFNQYEAMFAKGRKVFWFKVCFLAMGWSLGLFVFLSFWFGSMR